MIAISKKQSRYLALLLLVMAAVTLIGILSYPVFSLHASQAATIEQRKTQLARYQQLADGQEALQQELVLLKSRSPAAGYYVQGESPALAAARIRQYLKQIVDRNGGELISTQILQQDDQAAENSTSLRVQLRTDINASSQILYLLESGRPLLFMDNLAISARLVRATAQGAPAQVSLDMTFDLTGYLQEGA